ncbi:MAG: Pyridine nucleotide-disulfide oxidoreductase, FAD/NAD(P)-binding domain-containing protein [Parcubacteria group bacterium GW2011_GWF2_43_11]|nr:MAG: Pyridine nucleotide-disulfide oxidoreductase, FAD/NAD(P)-binding domain-containing protein [Parcubacteria group bacterium GW2011_GWF2_43_11]
METIYDLIIIGGGPAGMTAGIYAARQQLKTLLVTKEFGGQMAKKAVNIENYPGFEEVSGLDLIKSFEKHLKSHEIVIEMNAVKAVKKDGDVFSLTTADRKEFKSKTVLIASGADPRPLEVEGEKEFIGKGVSYCVSCDGPLFIDKTVVVVGGGNAGLEAALSLSNYAKKVYIMESGIKSRAEQIIQDQVKKISKISLLTEVVLQKIQGKNFVESVVYQEKTSKKPVTLEVQGLFVEIGSQPATSFVKDLVDFNEKDEIVADPKTAMTRTPGLFSAGDVDDVPYKQVVIACGEGAKAAISVSIFLQKNSSKE